MIENLHRWLVVRLLLVWLVLSLAIGGIVHYLGNVRLDDHVVVMAKSETVNYKQAVIEYLQAPSEGALARLNRNVAAHIEHDNLIAVEFYDANSIKITEAVAASARDIEEKLPKHGSEFSDKNGVVCTKMEVNNDTYLRVFVPLTDKSGKKIGYLEGIYHAPSDIIAQIKSQTLWSLVLVVLVVLATSIVLYPLIIRLNRRLVDYSRTLALTNIGMLKVLGSAIAKRDSDTNEHNYRVTLYAVHIGEKLGLTRGAMQGLIKGSFLHDLGKIAIADAILHKPGKLSEEEFSVMKSHVRHGEDIIQGYDWLKDARDVVVCHHEKFDGSGYPVGTSGSVIPLNARIFAVADVFDALTSKRPYKEPFSFAVAVGILQESSGNHFDPEIVRVFLEHVEHLYGEICHGGEDTLHGKLESYIDTYF